MARPQRNNVDYFPFYCEEGKKMYYLEETYGNDGFAVFIKLLRELARTDYHYLDLSKNTTFMFLSAKCKVSKEVLTSIINDLVDLEKFDSVLWKENSIIWCQDFIDSIQDAYDKRTNNCITYKSLLLLLDSLGVRKLSKSTSKPSKSTSTVPVNPQTILEYSKEKDNISFSDFWDLYDKKRGDKESLKKKWDKLSNSDQVEIMEYIPKYKQSQPDKKYRKDPNTFLNNKSWQDELIVDNKRSNTTVENNNLPTHLQNMVY